MNLLTLNLVLAFIWGAITGSYQLPNLLFGFAMGYAALWLLRGQFQSKYFLRTHRVISLLLTFIYELIVSSLTVARDVLSPRMDFKPGIVAIPLDAEDDFHIMLFANLITLTPGTMSVDVSDDKSTLYVHAMRLEDDPSALVADMKETFEARIVETMS